jgi:uncharacterized protein (DUF433 family)
MAEAKIVLNPEIRFGKPTIQGTRITVEQVLRMAANGHSEDSILDAFPHITVADVRSAFGYAAEIIARKRSRQVKGPTLPA